MMGGELISLRVLGTQDDWQGGRPQDIAAVCLSAADGFETALMECPLNETICIEQSSTEPITLYQRSPAGEVRVQLTARSRRWAQFSYQFAHELCHVMANFRPPNNRPTTWIEETLCEVASLYTLKTMNSRWSVAPPYPNWKEYAPALSQYVEDISQDPKHQIPYDFSGWLNSIVPLCERDPYRREDNMVIARCLMSIFENNPAGWHAIRYLNKWSEENDAMPSCKYFEVWRSVTPAALHWIIDQIEKRLSIRVP